MGKLVAYSGFSATNYLEMPYNPDLDFGTGDFCVMGWINKSSTASLDTIASRYTRGNTGADWKFETRTSTGLLSLAINNSPVVVG